MSAWGAFWFDLRFACSCWLWAVYLCLNMRSRDNVASPQMEFLLHPAPQETLSFPASVGTESCSLSTVRWSRWSPNICVPSFWLQYSHFIYFLNSHSKTSINHAKIKNIWPTFVIPASFCGASLHVRHWLRQRVRVFRQSRDRPIKIFIEPHWLLSC